MTELWLTKALGSMLLIRRKMVRLSRRFASRHTTLVGLPLYHPWPSRMVRLCSVVLAMALAISWYFFEKMKNCTDCRWRFIT